MQSTYYTREREGESRREKRGQSHWAEADPHTHTHTRSHTVSQLSDNSTGVHAGRYVAVAPTSRDSGRGSWTNCGLTGVGCFKGKKPLILSGGGVTLGDVWSVGGEFSDSCRV